jgi:hypothetical protein
MKRNEIIKELKEKEIKFNMKMKNEELLSLLNDSNEKKEEYQIDLEKKSDKKEDENMNEKKEMNLLEMIQDEKIKESNFQDIHERYKNESEISFFDSIEKIQMNDDFNMKDYFNEYDKSSFNDDYEFIMIHRESRKIYYLFLYDKKNDSEYFIMKNDSIMKNKIYLMKFSQFFEIDSLKISYIKNDRKNQSKEIIDRNSKSYEDKIKKYSMI